MADSVFKCILLLLLIALVGGSCSAIDQQRTEVEVSKDAAADGETLDLYGPDMDESELRLLMPMTDIKDMAPKLVSAASDNENDAEPKIWTEPDHKLDLIRLLNGRYYGLQYKKINELLTREVESPNLEANMAVLTQWLERERQKGVGFLNKATVEALQQLIDLFKLKDKKLCNRDAYTTLFKNNQATGRRIHKPQSELQPLTRVDALVYQLFMSHAIECFNEYPVSYANARESMNQDVRRMVESFLDSLLGDPLAVSSKVKSFDNKAVGPIAYKFLRMNALDDRLEHYLGKVVDERNGKLIVDEKKVREVVNKYIVQPCKDYNQATGPDVFLPAGFDAKMFEREDRYHPDSRLLNEFLHGFIHFRLCERLIKRDEPYLIKSVVKHIYSL